MEAVFGPIEEGIKNYWHQSRFNFSVKQTGTPFLTTKGMKKIWKSCK